MTHVRVWKFRPDQARQEDFVAAYNERGIWSKQFSRSAGYQGTSLLSPADAGGWWLTIDRWHSRAEFEVFQRDFGDRYRSLDAELDGVAGEEEFVGAFEQVE